MRPELFSIGTAPIYSYMVFMVLAYLAGLTYAYLEAKRQGQDPIHAVDLSLVLFFFGILGARLLFIIIDYKRFLADPREIYRLWNGGLVFYGGLIIGVIAGVILAKKRGLDIGFWADIMAPTGMIGLAFGRIGCFLNGCCYGKVAQDLPWGVVYPPHHPSLMGLAQVKVHPAPIYESMSALVIFVALVVMTRFKKFKGQIFWTMVFLYAVARFIIENFRGDPRGSIPLANLSTSQTISVMAAAVALVMLINLYRRSKLEDHEA